MSKYQPGEFIPFYLTWDMGELYIMGHVEMEEAKKVFERGDPDYEIALPYHTWARWQVGRDEDGERGQFFSPCDKPGRGCFKVTAAKVIRPWKYAQPCPEEGLLNGSSGSSLLRHQRHHIRSKTAPVFPTTAAVS